MNERHSDNLEADLSAYLDGELSGERAREIEDLIARSDEAARTLDELRAVSDAIGALPQRSAPPELMFAVTRKLAGQSPADSAGLRRQTRVLRLVGQVTAAAAVLAACVYVSLHALDRRQPAYGVATVSRQEAPRPTESHELAPDVLVGIEPRVSRGLAEEAATPETTREPRERGRGVVQRGHKKSDVRGVERLPSAGAAGVVSADVATGGAEAAAGISLDGLASPTVKVWITPASVEEYQAASDVLAQWRVENAPPKAGEDVNEDTYYFAAADLSRRIGELNDSAPSRVRVQMSFSAADRGFLELAAGGQRGSTPRPGDLAVAYATSTDMSDELSPDLDIENSAAPVQERRPTAAPSAPPRQPQPSRHSISDDKSIDMDEEPVSTCLMRRRASGGPSNSTARPLNRSQ